MSERETRTPCVRSAISSVRGAFKRCVWTFHRKCSRCAPSAVSCSCFTCRRPGDCACSQDGGASQSQCACAT